MMFQMTHFPNWLKYVLGWDYKYLEAYHMDVLRTVVLLFCAEALFVSRKVQAEDGCKFV